MQSLNSEAMEINLTPNTEAQLQHLATSQGKQPAQVAEETLTRVLQHQAEFIEGVQRGIAAADRGEFVEDKDVRLWPEERERS